MASLNVKGPLVAGALAAIGASICCVGPLVLLTLGIGGVWVGNLTALETMRPFFIGVTLLFIMLAFRENHGPCRGPIFWRNLRLSAVLVYGSRGRNAVSIDHIEGSAPIACTLSAQELTSRFAEIGALAERALLGHEQDGRTLRLRFAVDAMADLERLVEQERKRCPFLEFEMRKGSDTVRLSVAAPVEAGAFAQLSCLHFVGQAPAGKRGCSEFCGCGNASPQ